MGMKTKRLLFAVAMCAVLPSLALEIDLTRVKVVRSGAETEYVKLALEELAKHLERVSGAKPDGSGVEFVVGARPADEPEPKAFESHVKVADGKVWFWGDDSVERNVPGWPDRERSGTLFAVYEFLDEALGVRWPYPGDDEIFAPSAKTLVLEEGWRRTFYPPLTMTEIRNCGSRGTNPDGSLRKQKLKKGDLRPPKALRASDAELDRDADIYARWLLRHRHFTRSRFHYGHAFKDWQDRYLKDHPDWFGLSTTPEWIRKDTNGRGLPDGLSGRAKFCLSNPEVAERIVAEWKEKGAPEWYNICPNDGTPGFCHCANCLKLDARTPDEPFLSTLSDRYVWFWNRIAEKAVKVRPDVKLLTYIYSYYRLPTRRERIEYPENLIAGTVPSIGDDAESFYAGWQARGLRHHFLRPNYLCYTAAFYRGYERIIYNAFHIALRYGSIGIDFDGGGGDYRQKDLESYVSARMAAYPDKPFEAICDEFYAQFGVAASDVKAVRERIRTAGEAALDRTVRSNPNHRKLQVLDDSFLGKYAVFGNTEESLRANLETLRTARGKPGLTPDAARRLDGEIVRAEHLVLCFRFYDLGKRAAGADRDALVRAAKDLYEFRVRNKALLGHVFGGLYSAKGCEADIWRKLGGVER